VTVTPRPLFTPGKDPVPIVQEAGWTPRPVWTGAGFDPRTVQPVASRYTDYATRLTMILGTVRYPQEYLLLCSENALKLHKYRNLGGPHYRAERVTCFTDLG